MTHVLLNNELTFLQSLSQAKILASLVPNGCSSSGDGVTEAGSSFRTEANRRHVVGGDALRLECGLIGRTAPPHAAKRRKIQAKIIVVLLGAARSSSSRRLPCETPP